MHFRYKICIILRQMQFSSKITDHILSISKKYCHQPFGKYVCISSTTLFLLQVVENIVTLLTDYWSDWSSWSNCTKACGIGSRTRTRTCKSLFKRNESDCKHLDHREEVEPCNQQECQLSSSKQIHRRNKQVCILSFYSLNP